MKSPLEMDIIERQALIAHRFAEQAYLHVAADLDPDIEALATGRAFDQILLSLLQAIDGVLDRDGLLHDVDVRESVHNASIEAFCNRWEQLAMCAHAADRA